MDEEGGEEDPPKYIDPSENEEHALNRIAAMARSASTYRRMHPEDPVGYNSMIKELSVYFINHCDGGKKLLAGLEIDLDI